MREYGLLFVVVLLFAGNILVGKAAADALAPFTLALARSVIAFAAALIFFAPAAWRARQQFFARAGRLFVIGATGIGLFNALLYAALHTTDANSVAVLEASIPLFTALIMWLIAGEQLSAQAWGGVVLSTIGAIVVVSRGVPTQLFVKASIGDVVMLGAVAAWILYALAGRRGLADMPRFATMVPLTLSACIALLPLAIIEQWLVRQPLALSFRGAGSALYLGLGPSFVGFIIYNRALVKLGPTVSAISLNGLPLVVMAGGWAWFGAPVNTAQIAGACAVVLGVTLLLLYRTPTRG